MCRLIVRRFAVIVVRELSSPCSSRLQNEITLPIYQLNHLILSIQSQGSCATVARVASIFRRQSLAPVERKREKIIVHRLSRAPDARHLHCLVDAPLLNAFTLYRRTYCALPGLRPCLCCSFYLLCVDLMGLAQRRSKLKIVSRVNGVSDVGSFRIENQIVAERL